MAVISGTPGADSLTGTDSRDSISGLAGNDTLSGLGGADTISAGDGNDRGSIFAMAGTAGEVLDRSFVPHHLARTLAR